MNEQIQNIQTESEESSIDFGSIWQAVKSRRRLYYIALPVAFVLAAVYTLSLPNYYNCQVKLSPELSSRRTGNSLATLASSFGVNISLFHVNASVYKVYICKLDLFRSL